MKLIFASHNAHKVEEIKKLVPVGFEVLSLTDIGLHDEIPETGETLEENALIKARYVFERKSIPVFADDTGLEIQALNGEPGVYSARYAGEEKSSEKNMDKVLVKLGGQTNRYAAFRTVIAYIDQDGMAHSFEGAVHGKILEKQSGEKGFGYDPIFQPNGYDLSFAQMGMDAKNEISHRGRALKKFMRFLRRP